MTSVLLDTHALVWAVGDPARLGDSARRLIQDRNTDLLISAATAWEIATKVRIGRFPDGELFVDRWSEVLQRLQAREMAITAEHAMFAGSLDWPHRDPFDRVIAAQSLLERVPLLSADTAFAGLPGLRVRW